MPMLKDIKLLISQGESSTLEFKMSTAKLKQGCETICGFLNNKGGTIIFGVKNNGDIIGQHVTDQTQLEISNHISKFEPAVSLDVEYIAIDGADKSLIKITALPDRNSVPYIYDGRPYARIEASTKLMPQSRYAQLLLERGNKANGWDLMPANNFNIDDLDGAEILNAINDSIRRGRMESRLATEDPKEALLRFKLLRDGGITNAAVVLFCRDPMPYYPQCLLRLFKFKGKTKSDLLDSRRVYGNASVLLEEAENFLLRHMTIASEFIPGKMARKDIPDYPPRAVREAMVNAICHRNYSIQGGSISMMIYSDRLEVTSHGTLPFDVTVESLMHLHDSQPRNELITNVMYRRGVIESAGTGTQLMIQECLDINKPQPVYTEQGNTFIVCFRSPDKAVTADERQEKILTKLKEHGALSLNELKDQLDIEITDRTLRRDLKHLSEIGFIKLEGRGASAKWKVLNK